MLPISNENAASTSRKPCLIKRNILASGGDRRRQRNSKQLYAKSKARGNRIPPAPGLRWLRVVYWSHPFPSSLGEGFTPPPTPSPGPQTPRIPTPCYVLLRLFGHLDAIHFSFPFSMPSWIDLGSIFPPNLPPKIHQNPLKIDAKMPSHLDSIF